MMKRERGNPRGLRWLCAVCLALGAAAGTGHPTSGQTLAPTGAAAPSSSSSRVTLFVDGVPAWNSPAEREEVERRLTATADRFAALIQLLGDERPAARALAQSELLRAESLPPSAAGPLTDLFSAATTVPEDWHRWSGSKPIENLATAVLAMGHIGTAAAATIPALEKMAGAKPHPFCWLARMALLQLDDPQHKEARLSAVVEQFPTFQRPPIAVPVDLPCELQRARVDPVVACALALENTDGVEGRVAGLQLAARIDSVDSWLLIMEALQDPDMSVQLQACGLVRGTPDYGDPARLGLPKYSAVLRRIEDNDTFLLRELYKLDMGSSPLTNTLAQRLAVMVCDGGAERTAEAVEIAALLGPRAAVAEPALLGYWLEHPDDVLAAQSLIRIGLVCDERIPQYREHSTHADLRVRVLAACMLIRNGCEQLDTWGSIDDAIGNIDAPGIRPLLAEFSKAVAEDERVPRRRQMQDFRAIQRELGKRLIDVFPPERGRSPRPRMPGAPTAKPLRESLAACFQVNCKVWTLAELAAGDWQRIVREERPDAGADPAASLLKLTRNWQAPLFRFASELAVPRWQQTIAAAPQEKIPPLILAAARLDAESGTVLDAVVQACQRAPDRARDAFLVCVCEHAAAGQPVVGPLDAVLTKDSRTSETPVPYGVALARELANPAAAKAAAATPRQASVDVVFSHLTSPSWPERRAALDALRRLEGQPERAALARLLTKCLDGRPWRYAAYDDMYRRRVAIWLAGELGAGGEPLLPQLEALARTTPSRMGLLAAFAAVKIAPGRADEFLPMLITHDLAVRRLHLAVECRAPMRPRSYMQPPLCLPGTCLATEARKIAGPLLSGYPKLMEGKEFRRREAAVCYLQAVGNEAAIDQLIATLCDVDDAIHACAKVQLRTLGETAYPQLAAASKSNDEFVSSFAGRLLAEEPFASIHRRQAGTRSRGEGAR